MSNQKGNILFIQPMFHDPTLPNFKDRFEMLSQNFHGHVFAMTHKPESYDGMKFGNFIYHAVPYEPNKWKRYTKQLSIVMRKAMALHKESPYDVIHCYDPLMLGLIGAILKLRMNVKLVVEINGHLKKDAFLEKKGLFAALKRFVFLVIVRVVLCFTDHVKFLNPEQKEEWQGLVENKKHSFFHDFVATHVFAPTDKSAGNYIFFIGHPFFRKGIDILIKAFLRIADQFPDVKLKVVGHCHGREKERQRYIDMAEGNQNVEVLEPVFFDEAIGLFEECLFFVLPSRSEAMGRVLIEAMAAGKAVIGSRVGGIPQIIEDNGNGVLFESENVDDLAGRMKVLLSDQDLRKRMEKRSLELVEERFSSLRYVEEFNRMIKETLCQH